MFNAMVSSYHKTDRNDNYMSFQKIVVGVNIAYIFAVFWTCINLMFSYENDEGGRATIPFAIALLVTSILSASQIFIIVRVSPPPSTRIMIFMLFDILFALILISVAFVSLSHSRVFWISVANVFTVVISIGMWRWWQRPLPPDAQVHDIDIASVTSEFSDSSEFMV